MGLAQVNIRFKADLSGFSSEMQNVSRQMQSVGTKMSELGKSMSLYVTGPLLAGGAAAIKFASDYEESLNKVNVAFGSSSESVKAFAKDTLTTSGIAEGTALDMAAGFGDMATSMGLPQSAAAKMSTSLVGLAGDLASFKNIGIDQANTALSGIFTGETESLKKLGIVLTEANLQQFAYSKGIKVQIKDMDQASKVNLRYAYIMANTTNAQGDFVRTGGGAANQMRIFQESLKQLAQQFGSVILPAFTKMITYVNGLIKGFGELSPATKTVIVGVAAVAAAIGPLMVGLGNLIGIVPRLIVQFNALKATMLANPYTALAVGIAAIGTAIYMYVSSTKEAVSAQTALNDAVKKGNENAASEVASLDTLYKTSTNVKLSINERKKAVDELQALYPAYFKNIKDEAILNGTASASYRQLREDIFNKARAIAVDNEIQKRANDRVIQETALREKILATEKGIQRIRNGADVIVLQEASAIEKTAQVTATKTDLLTAQYKLLKIQRTELATFNAKSLKEDEALLKAKQDFGAKSSKLAQNEIDLQGQIGLGIGAIKSANDNLAKSREKVFAPGTIAFYENEISKLKTQQEEVSTTEGKYYLLGNEIQRYLDLIAKIQPKRIEPLQATSVKVESSGLGQTADEFQLMQERITASAAGMKSVLGGFAVDLQYLAEVGSAVGASVSEAFSGLATNVVESFGLAKSGFEGFVGGLLQTVTKLIAMMLASAVSQSIAGATASGTATGPAAIFTTPAFIATAVGGVLAAFASIPKFETGGVVSGSSYYGDKILARVNSGEMIANKNQQKAIYGMMNSGSNVNVNVGGTLRASGSDLLLVIERAEKKKDRTG
jgi:hypothetical protein